MFPRVNETSDRSLGVSSLLKEYLDFERDCKGSAAATLVLRRLFVRPFLRSLARRKTMAHIGELSPNQIHDYVIRTSKRLTRPSRKHLASSLRSFLRFAQVRGHLRRNLVDAVPVIRTYKLDRLPRGICWEDVQRLLAAPDRRTPAGRRDFAILLLLASYGVRIGQVTHMRLTDIEWHQGLIHFRADKYGKPLCFPLRDEVAKALLNYIRRDRGNVSYPEIFLTIRGRCRPLSLNNHLGYALERYYKRAGVKARRIGAHPIRHAFATRLIQQGASIKTVADLLGHRSIESTFLYTKVHLDQLRTLAAEWPEVAP
jgi:site-specific recombinase XerD